MRENTTSAATDKAVERVARAALRRRGTASSSSSRIAAIVSEISERLPNADSLDAGELTAYVTRHLRGVLDPVGSAASGPHDTIRRGDRRTVLVG